MNQILKKLMDGVSDASSLARSITDSGIKSVSEVFKGIKIFGSLTVSSSENTEFDETHYVLVPLLGEERDFAIYTKRVLPPDIGTINSLPKARIFHVPDESGKELLERKLIEDIVEKKLPNSSGTSEFADALEKLADQIDRETNKLSGGLVLIGGAVAVLNPLLGVGIAAKGLLPSIGTKASKIGAEYLGNKLRGRNKSSETLKAQKEASKEVQRLKPQIYPNPILRSLDAIATNPETDFDPNFDHRNWVDEFESLQLYTVTTEAIQEVYQEILESTNLEPYQKHHIEWISSFAKITHS